MHSDFQTPQAFSLLHTFEANAVQQPDAIAVVCGNDHFSYHQLNHCTNQLGWYLQAKGIGPEQVVGLCLGRSFDLVVAILGIVKAGGAILPLEPSYPKKRIRFMLENAQPSLVLTQEHLREHVDRSGMPVICMHEVWEEIDGRCGTPLNTGIFSGNLFVILYTSGSTGQPKGVVEVHHLNPQPDDSGPDFNRQDIRLLQFRSTDRVIVKCPISFAPSLWEILEPLHAGGTLLVVEPDRERDFSHLIRLIIEQQATLIHFVPSALRLFLDEPSVRECSSLERVICSGESLPEDIRERFFLTLNTNLYLYYAATEAPAAALLHFSPNNRKYPMAFQSGNPTNIHVLTSGMMPVPHGQEGEVYVTARGKIRGYLGKPGLTAEQFLPDPWSSDPGSRLYRTGDIACYLPDDTIKIMGRRDSQVKIRGIRIELEEIEAILRQHPTVGDAVVICREDRRGEKELVGYVVSAKGFKLVTADIQSFLYSTLPGPMIPGKWIILPGIPLGPNGKINRQALPDPEQTDRNLPDAHQLFGTPLLAKLAEVWGHLLKVDGIRPQNNFFELGGNSILAIQICNRIRDDFGVSLSIKDIFENPTIAELGKRIGRYSEKYDTDSFSVRIISQREKGQK